MWPNIQRGFVVNAAELGTYDHRYGHPSPHESIV
jgi:hypothetical protein